MKLKYEFAIQEVMGVYIAAAVGENASELGGVIRLNDTARRIFELLQQETDEEQVVEAMLQEYDADENDMRRQVAAFVEQLRQGGVL